MNRFAFVAAERANHAVAKLCRVVDVSVSGFYAWLRAIPAAHAGAEAEAELRGHVGRMDLPPGPGGVRSELMPPRAW